MEPLSLFPDIVADAPPTEGVKYAGSKLKLLPHQNAKENKAPNPTTQTLAHKNLMKPSIASTKE